MIYNFIIKNIIIIVIILLLTLTLIYIEVKEFNYKKNGLTPEEAIRLINNNNAVLIDFRVEKEYKNCHIINSINIPLTQMENKKNFFIKNKKKILIIIEDKKYNQKNITKHLFNYGCLNTQYLKNGINSWIKDELPTIKLE